MRLSLYLITIGTMGQLTLYYVGVSFWYRFFLSPVVGFFEASVLFWVYLLLTYARARLKDQVPPT